MFAIMGFKNEIETRHVCRKRQLLLHSITYLKLELRLFMLFENTVNHRVELVNNRYYYGVIDPCELNYLRTITYTNSLRLNIFVLYEVDLNGSGHFDSRIYSPCGYGVNIKVLFDPDLGQWSFYTDMATEGYEYDLRRHRTATPFVAIIPGINKYNHTRRFLNYEDKKYINSGLFNTLDDLIRVIKTTYLCDSCYQLLEYPVATRAICLTKPVSRFRTMWTLQKHCSFLIKNLYHHKQEVLKTIVPKHIYKLIQVEGNYTGRDAAYKTCLPCIY
jgi:hypothetical protein